jgi:FixJ family two-component response regulator
MTPASPPSRRRVFIVDDEAEIRDALALMLATAGVDTQEYASAEGFWENAPHDEPYCLVLDHRLPGMSGLELLARIVERSKNAAVVMMTGHGDIPTAVHAMKLGAYHFTEKPFDAEALLSVVEDALARAERQSVDGLEAVRFNERKATLTEREAEVFELLLQGCPSKTVAAKLDVTVRTAEHHRAAVMRKLEVKSIAELMRRALSYKN